MKKFSFLLLFLLPIFVNAQTINIKGIVTDENNKILPFISIFTEDNKYETYSNASGEYSIDIPSSYNKLYFKQPDFEPIIVNIPKNDNQIVINIKLGTSDQIGVVIIEAEKINASGIVTVDSKIADILPSVSGGIESILSKIGMGVTGSRNELSSKYSVRGGSFDENLVYVNGIEIYRPQLVRSGQQEGLSFINPKLVSDAKFSSGGFESKYGGKMSSVLDITYKQAKKREFTTSISLLGASAHYQDISKNKKFSHISGFRYKTTRYMLNTLETEGEYNPNFIDFQTFWTYYFNSKFSINFLANISDNNFHFIPTSGTTNFGSIQSLKSLYISYFGQESDRFFSNTEAISVNYHPHKDLNFTLSFSGFNAYESETFDIIGFYSLNELNKDIGSETAGDSILNLGNGAYMRHARNYLNILSFSTMQTGYYKTEKHYFNWGLIYKYENINDKIDEWNLEDSASYSMPVNSDNLLVSENIKAENEIINQRFTAYIQDKLNFESFRFQYEFVGGIRANYSTFSEEFLLSPRIAVAAKSFNKNKHVFRFSSGIFNQPVFYKEIRDFSGQVVKDKSAQKSVHYVFGYNFKFKALGRNMKLFTEIYYKDLKNIIPFEMDNVRVRYYADVRTSGYVAGIDTKLMGDFVPGLDSWFSMSVLKTEEMVNTVSNGADTLYYIPRPTDQRFTANLFIQDYVPGNENFKAHLNLVYGSSFPFGFPKNIERKAISRSAPYHRVDLGASAVLIKEDKIYTNKFLKNIKSLWLTVEIFNMLDIQNTISYRWIHVVPNTSVAANNVNNSYPVPVKLTGRRFNLKFTLRI
ncbi:MAG: TonB-dependent receptor [Bacteroidales bacterium]|nr:TonB-dependent receptor [Bacteroidales bacterium]